MEVASRPPPLPQIKMSVPSSPLCVPLTALSAPTPMAAISAAPRRDAIKALSPTMMARPVWVSGLADSSGLRLSWITKIRRTKENSDRNRDALSCLNYSGLELKLTFLAMCPLAAHGCHA